MAEFEYPENLKYLDSHEYARADEDENVVTVGITAFAIDQLGDIVVSGTARHRRYRRKGRKSSARLNR